LCKALSKKQANTLIQAKAAKESKMTSLLSATSPEVVPLEQTLIQLRECFVYKVATTHSSRGFCAGDWGLDKPLATCTCIVKSRGVQAAIQLFDNKSKGQNNRKMLAQSVILLDPDLTTDKSKIEWYCESVTDSSRYFVLKVQNPRDPTKVASLGIGFRQKESAYSFTAALQDHAKYVKRLRAATSKPSLTSSEPTKDMSLAGVLGDGGKIKINVKITKKKKKKKKKDKNKSDGGLLSLSGFGSMSVTPPAETLGVGIGEEDNDFDDDDFGEFMT